MGSGCQITLETPADLDDIATLVPGFQKSRNQWLGLHDGLFDTRVENDKFDVGVQQIRIVRQCQQNFFPQQIGYHFVDSESVERKSD